MGIAVAIAYFSFWWGPVFRHAVALLLPLLLRVRGMAFPCGSDVADAVVNRCVFCIRHRCCFYGDALYQGSVGFMCFPHCLGLGGAAVFRLYWLVSGGCVGTVVGEFCVVVYPTGRALFVVAGAQLSSWCWRMVRSFLVCALTQMH